eukprot:TRINITY_DN24762_c0_g1_i1.p1 TRINITY_DN24762_c0_g1~~TRINITY_DN24762_c0_g1_i1.p1  ORF type:complete len:369 (+),score=107.71 TRINITY_DN24762_c0_g1_i1:87-1193(+)
MDNATALQLTRTGGTLLVLGFPAGATFGVDMKSWTTGDRFQGVKMVPHGVHVVTSSAADTHGTGLAAAATLLVTVGPGEVVVLEWEAEHECLMHLADEDAVARYADGVKRMEFDNGLAPYPLDTYPQWRALTASITPEGLERVRPVEKVFGDHRCAAIASSTLTGDGTGTVPHAAVDAAASATQQLAVEKLFFTPAPGVPPGATGAEITQWHMDGSGKLRAMARRCSSGDVPGGLRMLVGELQVAFVLFLIGQNYTAFEQWKTLLGLFMTAQDVVEDEACHAVTKALLDAVTAHLTHLPEEFTVSENALLPSLMGAFHDITASPSPIDEQPSLRDAVDAFLAAAAQTLGGFEQDGDDGPMVLDAPDED